MSTTPPTPPPRPPRLPRWRSPVLVKELVQLASGRSWWLSKTLLLTVLWVGGAVLLGSQPTLAGPLLPVLGHAAFTGLGDVALSVILLVAPLITAGCVCGEREANTLGLLFLTRLTHRQIVQDKGLARLTLLAMLVLMSVPFLLGCLLLGGVEEEQVLNLFLTLGGSILLAGGVSLWASARCRKVATAQAVAYSVLVLYLFATSVVWQGALQAVGEYDPRRAYGYWGSPPAYTSTAKVLFVSLRGWLAGQDSASVGQYYAASYGLPAGTAPPATPGGWMNPYLALHNAERGSDLWGGLGILLVGLVVYRVAVGAAVRRLRRHTEAESVVTRMTAVRDEPVLKRDLFAWWRPWHPARLLHRRGRPGKWPCVWKEADGLYDALKFLTVNVVLLFWLVPFLLYLYVQATGWRQEWREWFGPVAWAQLPVGLLLWLLLAAASVARERHRQTFEVLLSTRLSGAAVVLAHFAELAKYLALVAAMPLLARVTWLSGFDWDKYGSRDYGGLYLPVSLAEWVASGALLCALGVWASLGARTTSMALVRLAGALLLLNLLPLLLHALGVPPNLVLLTMPWPHGVQPRNGFDFSFQALLALHWLVVSGAAIAVVVTLSRRFDRIVGRQTGQTAVRRAFERRAMRELEALARPEAPVNAHEYGLIQAGVIGVAVLLWALPLAFYLEQRVTGIILPQEKWSWFTLWATLALVVGGGLWLLVAAASVARPRPTVGDRAAIWRHVALLGKYLILLVGWPLAWRVALLAHVGVPLLWCAVVVASVVAGGLLLALVGTWAALGATGWWMAQRRLLAVLVLMTGLARLVAWWPECWMRGLLELLLPTTYLTWLITSDGYALRHPGGDVPGRLALFLQGEYSARGDVGAGDLVLHLLLLIAAVVAGAWWLQRWWRSRAKREFEI